jgi:hypothetical protein
MGKQPEESLYSGSAASQVLGGVGIRERPASREEQLVMLTE